MKIQSLLEAINYYQPPKADPEIVAKFADVDPKLRSYYIVHWAKDNGIDSDDAHYMAGYEKNGSMWNYVGLDEDINEADEKMIGQPDGYYDAEERIQAYKDLQDALDRSSKVEAQYVVDGHCPECPNVEDDEDCYGFGNYGCDDGELTYNNETVSWKEIKDHDERQAERQKAKDNYPGDEAVIDFAASTAKQLKMSGQDPRDTLEYVKNEYPSMGRAQRASLVAKGMKKAGLTSEGKSPHKKGSAKYKKHMAAKHASMGENMNERAEVEKIKSPNTGKTIEFIVLNGQPFDKSGGKLPYPDFYDIMLAYNYGSDIAINTAYKDYVDANMNVKGYNPGHPMKETIQAGDELMIETAEGEGIVVPVLHVVRENILVGWDDIAEGIVSEDEAITELKKLAGLDEGDMVMYAKPDEVKKEINLIQKNGFPMSGKFINWCKENNCTFSMDFKDPKNLQKAAIAKIKFEKETGYGTDGEILNKKPPLQQELPFDPKTRPEQKEFDFEEDLDEAEYQGRKVKLNKPMQGDVKKFKVYVKDPKTGNVKKVNFGHGGSSAKGKTMKIRKSNPKARKSFRARHNCDNPGPKTKARYWSCRKW